MAIQHYGVEHITPPLSSLSSLLSLSLSLSLSHIHTHTLCVSVCVGRGGGLSHFLHTHGSGTQVSWGCLRGERNSIPFLLSSDAVVLLQTYPRLCTTFLGTQVALGLTVTTTLTVDIRPDDGEEGFATWAGRMAPYLITFMDRGEEEGDLPGQAYLDYCPPGMYVSGYQVGQGPVVDKLRIRCSCVKCGEPPGPVSRMLEKGRGRERGKERDGARKRSRGRQRQTHSRRETDRERERGWGGGGVSGTRRTSRH